MFDFRYHALSLGAVFLALGLGILLGVTIGDSLVSDADRSLRTSLRNDVVDARGEAREAQQGIERRDQLIANALPSLVRGRLIGQRVALVSIGPLPEGVESNVKDAVEAASGELDSVTGFALPDDAAALGEEAGGRFAAGRRETDLLESLARRIAVSLGRGGQLVRRLAERFPKRFEGDYRGAGAVVFYRSPPEEDEDEAEARGRKEREAFEKALLEAFDDEGVKTVGVEQSRADPSQVPFYRDRRLSSVDSVDLPPGRIALVYLLGGEEGTFGLKGSAKRAAPELSGD